MPWWAWIIVGAILLGSELAFIDAQFYLVFFGTAAILVGMLGLGGVSLPDWAQWLTFAALSVASMVFFRRQLYDMLRKNTASIGSDPAGEEVTIASDLAPGDSCRVDYRGSTWTAKNDSDNTIVADSRARIVRVEGLTLQIRPRT